MSSPYICMKYVPIPNKYSTYVGFHNLFQTGILSSIKAVHLLQRKCRRILACIKSLRMYVSCTESLYQVVMYVCRLYWFLICTFFSILIIPEYWLNMCEWVCVSAPLQITLGVLFIIVQVSWLLGYFGKFKYFIVCSIYWFLMSTIFSSTEFLSM